MYVLLPLLPPLVLLAVMGMAWLEDHLLPPAGPPPQARTKPVQVRDTLTADRLNGRSGRIRSQGAREPARGIAMPFALTADALIVPDQPASGLRVSPPSDQW